jgi:hypothetical protein
VAASDDVLIVGAAFTVQVSACVASREFASVTFTVNEAVPAADGVPASAPLEAFNERPAGRLPLEMLHV